ncbi:MAG: transglutaminase domain-containing protein [Anaerovoracaceae bacterium]
MKSTHTKNRFITLLTTLLLISISCTTTPAFADSNNPTFRSLTNAKSYYSQEFLAHQSPITFQLITDSSSGNKLYKNILNSPFAEKATNFNLVGDYNKYSIYSNVKVEYSCRNYYGKYRYAFTFIPYYKTTVEQENEFNVELKNVMASLNLTKKTPYERVKSIYDYICTNVSYDNEHPDDYDLKYTAYSALINKKAVCQGYACLFYIMCKEANIPARIIAGYGQNQKHAWNIVKLDDYYYNIDATWGSANDPKNYFLISDDNFLDHHRYKSFRTKSFNRIHPMATNDYQIPL